MGANPKCFISYSWEDEYHKDWVRFLAAKLQDNGVAVILDQWHLRPGSDLTHFMESSVRDSDYVLLICTPEFSRKSDLGKGGVGYEKLVVTGEIFQGINKPEKFVPILRKGAAQESFPSYLKSRVYVDFTKDVLFDSSLLDLLRHLHNSPTYCPPPIGPKPIFEQLNKTGETKPFNDPKNVTPAMEGVYCVRCGGSPGRPTKCPGYTCHDFATFSPTDLVYCKRCGALPGNPTKCPGYTCHDFAAFSKTNVVYCRRCGGLPGNPTKCPGYTCHDFATHS